MTKRIVYADNAATTRIADEVFSAMAPYLKEQYGNPSTLYSLGRDAKKSPDGSTGLCCRSDRRQ